MKRLFFVLTCLFIGACNSTNPLKSAFTKTAPYEQYLKSLEKADLHTTPMALNWINAGQRVFSDSIIIQLPFTETGFFQAGEPDARSYRFEVKEGQVLTVEAEALAEKDGRLFIDLFAWEGTQWERLAHADSTLVLVQEFRKDQSCLLRIQPELLANVYYSIRISLTPVLINPVSGASNRSIGSFYGADRDGGRRRHEGVDIFAPRGTPVVAPVDGQVSRVGTSNLGGKVVWMRDAERNHSYYFAHLDSQLVHSGARVRQGDTLGLVGNTGNARTTPPHLHFGIYQRGSKDPIHFIRTLEEMTKLPVDTSFQVLVMRVKAQKANLRSGPGSNHQVIRQLGKNHWLRVIGQHEEWFRISLPDKQQAFVHGSLIEPAVEGEPKLLSEPRVLLSGADSAAVPVAFLSDTLSLEVMAEYENYQYVKIPQGLWGWVIKQDEGGDL